MKASALEKFFETPGLCDIKECKEVKEFLENYNEFQEKYREVTGGIDPLGATLKCNIKTVDWHIENLKKSK